MARLLIVSNRLPITVRRGEGGLSVDQSTGGLATGMEASHAHLGGLWLGWPGDLGALSPRERDEVDGHLARLRLIPVPLTRDEVARYYEGYSSSILWPLFHYSVARLPRDVSGFDAYAAVNRRFADAVADNHQEGDLVWVHDYQLMLVPQLVRERIPGARIGFFLHVPFPSSEMFRLLPQRERILEGLLGADLVGFHTPTYVRHFASSVLRITGAVTDVDRIRWGRREVRVGAFPMGVDAAAFTALASSPEVIALAQAHRLPGTQLLVGIDRLDYTKGIQRRLLAFRALLRAHPELRERVRLVQVAVPSRENVEAYRELRDEVDALVGRIHGQFATPSWSPIHYLHRALPPGDIAALYLAADALVVTPLRDGMNLVAKEFVAARQDGDGVLVLSEFAGAAAELSEALLVNPYDVERTAEALFRALTMGVEERRTRMAALRERVLARDVHWWARSFLTRLERCGGGVARGGDVSPPAVVSATVERAARAPRLVLLLDYDGTLVPFAPTPELAIPDAGLLQLLRDLAALSRTQVHLVSGRKRASLERWFGSLPIGLHAEHGVWSRAPGGAWEGMELAPAPWRAPVLAILQDFAERTPGSLVEEKTAGLAWHYRAADPEHGAAQAGELSLHLATLLGNVPVEILRGDMVLEVRPHGIDKGLVVARVTGGADPDELVLAIGDDRTDEDLFAALPAGSVAVHVGPSPTRASVNVPDVGAARRLVASLLERRSRAQAEDAGRRPGAT